MTNCTWSPAVLLLTLALPLSGCDAVRGLLNKDDAGVDSGATSFGTAATSPGAVAPSGTGDPCDVIPVATLEQLTGVKGLSSAKPILGKSKNGCRWANGVPGVAYDVLPMTGSADDMIARINQAASKGGVSFKKVDLGNGHVGALGAAPGSGGAPGMPAMGSLDLFLGDRYAAIIVMLPAGADAATVTVNVGKAFSAAAAKLPPAPDMSRH